MNNTKNNDLELPLVEKDTKNNDDEMSLSVTEPQTKKKPRAKKPKERKGRKCELRAGPICNNCKDVLKDYDIERLHIPNCSCYWCTLCLNEQKKPNIKNSLKLKRHSPDTSNFKNEVREETIHEFIYALDQASDSERHSMFEYMEKQDFEFVYFTWLKYSKVTGPKLIKDIDFNEDLKRQFSRVYKNLIMVNTLLSDDNVKLVEKIWGATVTYGHRNHTVDSVILKMMEWSLSKINTKEDNFLFTSKSIQELMKLWTDRKILNETDSVLKNLYNKISLIIN